MKKLFLALGFLFSLGSSTQAGLFSGGAPITPPGNCLYDVGGFADGCDAANQNAQVIFPSFFADARQSGQAIYKTSAGVTSGHPVPWNVPGVDYPVGVISADVNLTAASALSISGCSYVPGSPAYLSCSGATNKLITGGLFNDVAFDDSSTNHTTTFVNNHFIMGFNACRGWGSQAFVIIEPNTHQAVVATNNTWSSDNTCSTVANIFGLSNDPGLTVNTTGIANFSGTSMCYTSGPTPQNGTPGIHTFQHVHFTGQINSDVNNSTSNPISAPQIIASVGGGCYTLDKSQTTASGVTVTTGPQLMNIYGTLSQGEIGTATFTAKYNAFLGMNTLMSSNTGGSSDVEFNFATLNGDVQRHVNFFQQQPTPCDGGCTSANSVTVPFAYTKFNTALMPNYAAVCCTTIFGLFTTSATANTSPPDGYQVTYADVTLMGNIGISNKSMNGNNGVFAGGVTGAVLRTTNQHGTSKAQYTATSVAGTMTVSGVTGTIAIGDFLDLNCLGCVGFNNTSYVQITGGSGSTWTLNQSINFGPGNVVNYLYPGVITSYTATYNAVDPTGTFSATGGYVLDTDTRYGSVNNASNWNLNSGAVCVPGSC